MANILSQEEVDALLGALERGEEVERDVDSTKEPKPINEYDFRRPDRSYFRDQLSFFDSIHETFAQMYASALSVHLRSIVEIDLLSTDQRTYGEYVTEMAKRTSLFLFHMSPLEGHAVLEIQPSLVLTMIDRLFGGYGTQADFSRDLTDIEKAVMTKLVQRALSVLEKSYESIINLELELEEHLNSPVALQLLPESESVIMSTFELRMGDASGIISLCYPHLTVEPIIPKISGTRGVARRRLKDVPEGPQWISNGIEESKLSVAVELGQAQLTLRDFLDLKEGDVVPLENRAEDPVAIRVGPKVKAFGRPALRGSHRVVQIESLTPSAYRGESTEGESDAA